MDQFAFRKLVVYQKSLDCALQWETVGTFDLGLRERFFTKADTDPAESLLQEVTAMLTTMIKKAEARAPK
jgi:hypothetical protein